LQFNRCNIAANQLNAIFRLELLGQTGNIVQDSCKLKQILAYASGDYTTALHNADEFYIT